MIMTTVKHILLCMVLMVGGVSAAQTERKVVRREEPQYPDIAKRMNLHGAVKLKIWISPDGAVRRLEYVGGHPILAASALKAVKNWHYETASKESNTVVILKY
jgi:TonB family protein